MNGQTSAEWLNSGFRGNVEKRGAVGWYLIVGGFATDTFDPKTVYEQTGEACSSPGKPYSDSGSQRRPVLPPRDVAHGSGGDDYTSVFPDACRPFLH